MRKPRTTHRSDGRCVSSTHSKITQHNIIIDVLGGVSRETLHSIKELIGVGEDKILLDMQKAVIASTLNIARSFKVLTAA